MAETFLEEQIRRLREMSKQVSRVRPVAGVGDRRAHRPEQGSANQGERRARRHPDREIAASGEDRYRRQVALYVAAIAQATGQPAHGVLIRV